MSSFDDLLNNTPSEPNGEPQLSKEDYVAKKQDERDAVFSLSDQTAQEVGEDGGRFQQYLDVQSRFHRYSAVNSLLILAQKPEATRLADFDNWKRMGGFVKPGQAAISILEPHEYTKGDGTPGVGYNIKKVFDFSQVDARRVNGTPLPKYSDRQMLRALISNAPMKISGAENLSGNLGAYTDPETGEITVRKGMEYADTFRSVAQELSYAEVERAGHNTVDPRFTAYCSSYILCQKFGVDTQSFDFKSAPSMFRGFEPQKVKQELSSIRDAAGTIAERVARQLDATNRAAQSREAR